MSDSVSKDGGPNKVDFTASYPPNVRAREVATQDTTAWAVPGAVPASPSPRGPGFVSGKRGPS